MSKLTTTGAERSVAVYTARDSSLTPPLLPRVTLACRETATASDRRELPRRGTGRRAVSARKAAELLSFPNPKVGPASMPVDHWYRYYAGYSSAFVDYALATLAPKAQSVLDPWNGTGTTSVLAANRRLRTFGYDINPAMVVVAKGRLLHTGVTASIKALASDIVGHAERVPLPDDPLKFWFDDAAAAQLRGLQMSVQRLLVPSDELATTPAISVESMSTLAAFFYTALFRTTRSLAGPAAGSNPTWWKQRTEDAKLCPAGTDILAAFTSACTDLGEGLHGQKPSDMVDITLGVASSRSLPVGDGVIDAVVTSPPYCTRIDYAISTRPELAMLRYTSTNLTNLRNAMVGTPTMNGEGNEDLELGPIGAEFLDAVAAHPSKASAGYYLRYYKQYYRAMAGSLAEIRRVLRPSAPAVLVVQDTHYKQIRNDTPGILLEIARSCGFAVTTRHDFPVARTMAGLNPSARNHRASSAATESVLVLA
jgi:DNA modification methylase